MRSSRFMWLSGFVVAVCVFVAATAIVTRQSAASAATGGRRVLWGAYFGGAQYGTADAPWSMVPVHRFQREVGRRASLVHFALPWYKCGARCSAVPFPTKQMTVIRRAGKIPVIGWNSYSQPVHTVEPNFQLADIISGGYDAYIRQWARAAKAWGHPFFLKLDREMNLNCCYPYVEDENGNSPGQFVAMWRHVHRIFAAVGARNVTWVWAPNIAYAQSTPFAEVYPGGSYVNWSGLDGYNWGTNPAKPIGWRSFRAIFRSSYAALTQTVAPHKPLMVAETASTESGGSKATWIRLMLGRDLHRYFPRIRALMYFNVRLPGTDWPIESSPSATAAFGRGIQSSYYVGNRFAHLHTSPIRPVG